MKEDDTEPPCTVFGFTGQWLSGFLGWKPTKQKMSLGGRRRPSSRALHMCLLGKAGQSSKKRKRIV